MALTAPNPPAMPAPPSGDFYNETQWSVLMALLDAVVPSLVPESAITDPMTQEGVPDDKFQSLVTQARASMASPPDEQTLKAYLAERPSADSTYVHGVRRALAGIANPARVQLGAVLLALSTRAGSLMLTGHAAPVQTLTLAERAAVIRRWGVSWFATPRLLWKSFTMLARVSWLQVSPLFRQASGYPDVPRNWRPGPAVDYVFLQFEAGKGEAGPAVIDTDVVIVGSGCGGGVCAKVLAEAGHRVLVVDKGYYFPPEQLPMPQEEGTQYLYENAGFVQSTDNSIALVAGSCWGGGGTVNWSCSLQTQGFVRREWAEEHGLPFFETAEFQVCLDRVCEFMGAGTKGPGSVKQSHRGQVILDGSRKLGWHATECPQNTGGAEHYYCGQCHLGCGTAEKQGPAVSWLPAAKKAGADFIEGFAVEKVMWDEDSRGGDKKATGVIGKWTSRDRNGSVSGPPEERTTRQVVIKAKKVIIAAGTLNSPLILKNSGLPNPHIGRNLYLHPVNFVGAYYEEDIRPWEGGIITSVCTSFENLDGHGHGVKLEGMCMVPYAFFVNQPWTSGLDLKLSTLRFRHMDGFIALTRDRDTGRVFADPHTGQPRVEYAPSPFDAAHTLEGVVALAKLCYVTGATEIHAYLPGTEPFVRRANSKSNDTSSENMDMGVADPSFAAWLATLRAAGNRSPQTPFCSAHQMGTCRMSSHAGAGVVDPRGRVWGARDLVVADASVFPSASGVNPMVTNMAIADWIARGVAAEL